MNNPYYKPCVKCGFESFEVEYDSWFCSIKRAVVEKLRWNCVRCGYTWTTPTADQPPPEGAAEE